jgi:hypothetical protein
VTDAGITALADTTGPDARLRGPWWTTLPGELASVPAARRFVCDVLEGCPRLDDLSQAVTELTANAVLWSAAGEAGTFTLTIRTAPRWARVEVTDPGPAISPDGESNGWGLEIVAALTDRHGTTPGPGPARTRWIEVTWPP